MTEEAGEERPYRVHEQVLDMADCSDEQIGAAIRAGEWPVEKLAALKQQNPNVWLTPGMSITLLLYLERQVREALFRATPWEIERGPNPKEALALPERKPEDR